MFQPRTLARVVICMDWNALAWPTHFLLNGNIGDYLDGQKHSPRSVRVLLGYSCSKSEVRFFPSRMWDRDLLYRHSILMLIKVEYALLGQNWMMSIRMCIGQLTTVAFFVTSRSLSRSRAAHSIGRARRNALYMYPAGACSGYQRNSARMITEIRFSAFFR